MIVLWYECFLSRDQRNGDGDVGSLSVIFTLNHIKVNRSVCIAQVRQRFDITLNKLFVGRAKSRPKKNDICLIMEINIIRTVRIKVQSRCFLLIPSLQNRYNCQGYYTTCYKDKVCNKKETEFDKKLRAN